MQFSHSDLCHWFFSTPYRALEKAYQTSKKVRNIQKDYLYYKNSISTSSIRSWYNVGIYLNNVLNQSAYEIYWNLLEFKISKYFCFLVQRFLFNGVKKNFFLTNKKKEDYNHNLNKSLSFDQQENKTNIKFYDNDLFSYFPDSQNVRVKSNKNSYVDMDRTSDESIYPRQYSYHLNTTYQDADYINRKLSWIEAVLEDLYFLKNESWAFYTVMSQSNTETISSPFSLPKFLLKPKSYAPYESLGLVPRSITRTLSRFKKELEGRSASLVLPEFRLAKYQAVVSLQYMIFLILCPWLVSIFCKILFLEPWVENWWNTAQSQVFLSFSQEEKALRRLQEVEELLWLDIIMADSSTRQPQDLSAQIHQKTIDLVERYNQESINTILDLFTNFISVIVIVSLLIWGRKRLAILNSWVQEVFYSLSDTMKAFFILLLTDLCIGFHSPHGWEIFIGFLLEHLGFSHNKHVISCFVSTFPVILDTVFKYWIFRHLNRISPSIVVSYHTMNE